MPAPDDALTLTYLEFDLGETTDGVHTLEALASVQAAHRLALAAEVEAVLTWCRTRFPNGPGPLDEGHDWDMACDWTVDGGGDHEGAQAWHTVGLTLTGPAAFAEALTHAWRNTPSGH